MTVDEGFAVALPPSAGLRVAALAEPLSRCLRAVDKAGWAARHSALVIGGGPSGLLTALLEAHSAAYDVVVVEPGEYRRDLAVKRGFEVVDPRDLDVAEFAR